MDYYSPAASKGRADTPEMLEGHDTCMRAVRILQDVCRRVHTGSITIEELEHIKDRKRQMKKLCVVAASWSEEGDDTLQSPQVLNCYVEQRLNEYGFFQVYHEQLANLILQLKDILSSVQGAYIFYH